MDLPYRRNKIGFITETTNSRSGTKSGNFLSQRCKIRALNQLLVVLVLLSTYVEKQTQSDGKAVLSVGMNNIPIVRIEMNKGNPDTDFKAANPIWLYFDKLAKKAKEKSEQKDTSALLFKKQQDQEK